jgi:hypothetical protein
MADAAFRNHLLAVHDALIRGLVAPCVGRLTDHLRTCQKHFLQVEDAETTPLATGERGPSRHVLVALPEIVWAHEYAALRGDEHQRRHYVPEDEVACGITLSRPLGLLIEGYVTRSWLAQPSRFGVVREPRAVGLTPLAERHAAEISGLPYVVLNRDAATAVSPLDRP